MITAEYKRPYLYPKQQAALFTGKRYTIVEASTKSGKTVGALIWLFEQAISGLDGYNYWWVAPIAAQARIAYRRLKRMIPNSITIRVHDTELFIVLPNGATIWFKSADNPDSLYGEDVYAAVIDEATRVKELAWFAVRSTLTATLGPLLLIGNVKGKKNWVYRLARRAEQGVKNMSYARLTAYDAVEGGVFPLEEVEDAREVLPPEIFNELYLAIANDDGSNPFGLENIEKCIRELSPNEPVAFGVDLAKKRDYTVIIGLDALGQCCYLQEYQRPWKETVRDVVKLPPAYTVLDATGVGDPIVERVQESRDNVEGYIFSNRSRQNLLEDLALAITNKEITYPEIVRYQLESFEYQYTRTGVRYGAPEGEHDDIVMALALAYYAWKNVSKHSMIMIGRA